MKSRTMRRVAVLMTGATLAISLPVAGSGAAALSPPPDGNHGKACPHKGNPNSPKKEAPNDHGKKCGFHKQAPSAGLG